MSDNIIEEKEDKELVVSKCFDCEHCGKPYGKHRVNGKTRITRICNKHGIEVGENAATCEDGTNKIPMAGWRRRFRPIRSETGWEDF